MSVSERELLAGAVCHAYAGYVDSVAYWSDKRRGWRNRHEAYLQCVRWDLKRFREKVVEALRCLEAEATPMRELAEALHWLRRRIGSARHDMTLNEWKGDLDGAWDARDRRRYEYAIEVAECLVEVVRLEESHDN